MIWIWGM